MDLKFDKKTMLSIKRVPKKDNTNVLALMVFYENRKNIIFKVLGSVIYRIMENYLCADYLCLQQGLLYSAHRVF